MQSTFERFESPLAGKLHAVKVADARLSTILRDKRFDDFLQILGVKIDIDLKTIAPKEVLNRLQVSCDAGSIEFVICAKNYPAVALMYSDGLDERLWKLAAEALCSPIFNKLKKWGLSGAHVNSMSIDPSANGSKTTQSWYIAHTLDGQILPFAISRISDEFYDALLQKMHLIKCEKNLRSALTLKGNLILSSRAVRLEVLRKLSVGDVLLTDMDADMQKNLNASIFWGAPDGRKMAASCQVKGNCLTVTGEPNMNNGIDADPNQGPAFSPDALNDLELPVRFEIETVAIPLSDLESIKPGYVIEFTTPVDRASIRLVSAGQIVGHAELVAVGDRLGARITRMVALHDFKPAS
jgi:type III secretion protein Q